MKKEIKHFLLFVLTFLSVCFVVIGLLYFLIKNLLLLLYCC